MKWHIRSLLLVVLAVSVVAEMEAAVSLAVQMT